jgi:hypothetical protein
MTETFIPEDSSMSVSILIPEKYTYLAQLLQIFQPQILTDFAESNLCPLQMNLEETV